MEYTRCGSARIINIFLGEAKVLGQDQLVLANEVHHFGLRKHAEKWYEQVV